MEAESLLISFLESLVVELALWDEPSVELKRVSRYIFGL